MLTFHAIGPAPRPDNIYHIFVHRIMYKECHHASSILTFLAIGLAPHPDIIYHIFVYLYRNVTMHRT